MAAGHILVVDDEAHIRDVLDYALTQEGYRVTAVGDGRAALEAHRVGDPDLVVLDVMLPELDGLSVCREIRSRSETPILFLSARGEEIDRVLGLELGGDDYLTKPFSPRELIARVRAILRRADKAPSAGEPAPGSGGLVYEHGEVRVDVERHEVIAGGQTVSLTPTELGVLAALLKRPGVVLSRVQLMQHACGFGNHVTERTIDTHVRRIRAKFRDLGQGDPIQTVHGVGYRAAQ
ncbi:MAG: response regulator transcription factor [Deltaproteobacteria bacterium]|nr:response regulator transcription factor [Deltaproteobacteria bacterium]